MNNDFYRAYEKFMAIWIVFTLAICAIGAPMVLIALIMALFK